MKLETTKGDFSGTFDECAEWLEAHQPSHASIVMSHQTVSIDTDNANLAESLRAATVEVQSNEAAWLYNDT